MNTEHSERSETFAVGEAARLTLTNIRGQVDLQAGAEGVIAITARRHADDRSDATEVELSQAADGTVSAITRFQPNLLGWLAWLGRKPAARVDYTVRVPRHCAVTLSIVEGQAQVLGLTGGLDAHTVSGSLRLADLSGHLRVHTVSGDVLGERLTAAGAVHLQTVSGAVTLVESALPAVTASTVSGDLSLHTRRAAGPYTFNSVSGNIRLSVPAGTRCAVSLHSLSGRVHRSAPLSGGQGQVPAVSLHSVSGSLWLLHPEATPQPAHPGTAQRPARRSVLEQVSRGELSVDDAVSALKAH